jgi:hypothetical protein
VIIGLPQCTPLWPCDEYLNAMNKISDAQVFGVAPVISRET